MPAAAPPVRRDTVLAAAHGQAKMLTPPAVALRIVNAASRPDCTPGELSALLAQDPALCAKLLKVVNSCVYGLPRPVASLERAVLTLGLNPLRSLVLGLSLPVVQTGGKTDVSLRDFWIESVGGAILARELSARKKAPSPDTDLVAGLLRNLGAMLLRLAYPQEWADCHAADPDRALADPSAVERDAFGIDHAEVGATLLQKWNLPDDITEPIRFHHDPDGLTGPPARRDRAELLRFADMLSRLDQIADRPPLLRRLLATAQERYDLPQAELVNFLQGVAPKVSEFGAVLNLNVGAGPDLAATLAAACEAMVKLAVDSSRPGDPANTPVPDKTMVARTPPPAAAAKPKPSDGPPEFRPEFIAEFPKGGCRLGTYTLSGPLGRGAMGAVFKGFDPALRRDVAVKMLLPELAAVPVCRQRFAREARNAAAVRHDSVVAVFEVREAGGLPFMVTEFVGGGSLQARLDKVGGLPLAELTRVARQVVSGLAAAHARGIVHRDLKPENILLDANTGATKIADFGLARGTEDPKLTADGSLIGSPLYMSPEQVRGEPFDQRSDLWGMGGLLYAMCTGKPPFPGATIPAVFRAVVEDEPTSPRRVRPEVPAWMDAIVLRLLRKHPMERFGSIEEVQTVLDKLVR